MHFVDFEKKPSIRYTEKARGTPRGAMEFRARW